jgi:hypothetical protein
VLCSIKNSIQYSGSGKRGGMGGKEAKREKEKKATGGR